MTGDEPRTGPVDPLLRVVGGLLAVVGGFGAGALAVLLVPLRVSHLGWVGDQLAGAGAVRVPVAVVVTVAAGLFLVWFAPRATGRQWAAALPAVGWFAMVVLGLQTTTEGDRLLAPDDWVGTLALFGGTVVLVVGLVKAVASPGPRTPAGPAPTGRSAGTVAPTRYHYGS